MERVFVLINRGAELGFCAGRVVEKDRDHITVDYGGEVETIFSGDVIERFETLEETEAVSYWLNIIYWEGGVEYAEQEAETSSRGKYLPMAVRIEKALREAWRAHVKKTVVKELRTCALPF